MSMRDSLNAYEVFQRLCLGQYEQVFGGFDIIKNPEVKVDEPHRPGKEIRADLEKIQAAIFDDVTPETRNLIFRKYMHIVYVAIIAIIGWELGPGESYDNNSYVWVRTIRFIRGSIFREERDGVYILHRNAPGNPIGVLCEIVDVLNTIDGLIDGNGQKDEEIILLYESIARISLVEAVFAEMDAMYSNSAQTVKEAKQIIAETTAKKEEHIKKKKDRTVVGFDEAVIKFYEALEKYHSEILEALQDAGAVGTNQYIHAEREETSVIPSLQ